MRWLDARRVRINVGHGPIRRRVEIDNISRRNRDGDFMVNIPRLYVDIMLRATDAKISKYVRDNGKWLEEGDAVEDYHFSYPDSTRLSSIFIALQAPPSNVLALVILTEKSPNVIYQWARHDQGIHVS
ncbi:MAG: hypothetical protein SA339_03085 [Methanomassiliicoccus sp.]|nr:hypothetical protein [Methanomassiliicoccus sp.]